MSEEGGGPALSLSPLKCILQVRGIFRLSVMSQCHYIMMQLTGYVLIIGNINTVHSAYVLLRNFLKSRK